MIGGEPEEGQLEAADRHRRFNGAADGDRRRDAEVVAVDTEELCFNGAADGDRRRGLLVIRLPREAPSASTEPPTVIGGESLSSADSIRWCKTRFNGAADGDRRRVCHVDVAL